MTKAIQDEFTSLKVSRQRKQQLRRARDGKCLLCNQLRHPESATYCAKHQIAIREYQRQRRNKG